MRQLTVRHADRLAILCLLGGALLLSTAGRAAKTRILPARALAATSVPAFRLVLSRTIADAGQPSRLVQTTTREQRADGLYRLEQSFYAENGALARTEVYFGFIGYGAFRRDEVRRVLVFTGPLVEEGGGDVAAYLRQHPQFVREESVAGQQTIVWREGAADDADYREEYRSPALGGLLIKAVEVKGGRRETIEPTALDLREPAPALFAELSQWPADYAPYERKIARMEMTRQRDAAQVMRRLLSRARSLKP